MSVPAEQDPVASLRDVESESGDEDGLRDLYLLDRTEARELGCELDDLGAAEPSID